MDRDELSEMLARGWSLERIGAEVGRHPSTVAYWISQHGLEAAGRERHRGRGGLTKERLEAAIADDLSIRQIAEAVDRSAATVRYWLRRHGLRTSEKARRTGPRVERGLGHCAIHGETEFVFRGGRPGRCPMCRAQAVSDYRRRAKQVLIEEAGGRCAECGYDACPSALHFHHLDPAQKRFGIADRGTARSMAAARAEAAKCMLLCSNCHAEVESGQRRLGLHLALAAM